MTCRDRERRIIEMRDFKDVPAMRRRNPACPGRETQNPLSGFGAKRFAGGLQVTCSDVDVEERSGREVVTLAAWAGGQSGRAWQAALHGTASDHRQPLVEALR